MRIEIILTDYRGKEWDAGGNSLSIGNAIAGRIKAEILSDREFLERGITNATFTFAFREMKEV